MRSHLLQTLIRCVLGLLPIAILLTLWQLLSNGPSPHFPAPSFWLSAITQLWNNGQLQNGIKETFWIFGIGLSISITIGFFLGIIIGVSKLFREWTTYLFECFRAIPPPVIIPIAVLLMGYSDSMKVLIIVFATIWPILLNVVSSVDSMRQGTLDMGKALHLTQMQFIFKVIIPSVIPNAIIGIRVTIPLAIVITLLTEMLTGSNGLGGLMIAGQRNYNSAQVFGILIIVGILGLSINLLSNSLEKYLTRSWPPKQSL
ncbi:ABC transporter permease [Polynucleobacter kasalickyi]|uniref:Sulfonate transport system permease protein n=1 Tax=Polynucleobacter kasalickyi TaxID=1938817 RepID=A0A1W2B4P5_9BURK|nr:ABC transporter permease subunit [Polynucleobacter kasalickyi]SMC67896.1 sulfonate transport system permease protein [Polynucleobacter kasalickyi]